MNQEVSIASAAANGQFGFAETGVVIPSLEAWARRQDQELIAQMALANSVEVA